MVGFLKTNGTGCRFVSLLSETKPRLVSGCPYKGVVKIARRIGWLNINYNKAVRRNIAETLRVDLKDVEYTNGETWYVHVTTAEGKALPLCVNKKSPNSGKYYVQYFPHKSETVYVLPNGDTIAESLLEPYFYKGERTEFKPAVITLGLENIKELRASGLIIETADTAELEKILAAA